MPQNGSKAHIANGQHKFDRNRYIETVINTKDENVRQDRAQENKRGEDGPFGKQQQTQAIVGAPQRDPKPIELMIHRHLVEKGIERQEYDPDEPKLQTGRIRRAEEPSRLQGNLSLVSHQPAMNIHDSHFPPRIARIILA